MNKTSTLTTYMEVLSAVDPNLPASQQVDFMKDCIITLHGDEREKLIHLEAFLVRVLRTIKQSQDATPGDNQLISSIYLQSTPFGSDMECTIEALHFAKALLEENNLSYHYGVPKSKSLIIVIPPKGKEMELLICGDCKGTGEHRCHRRDVEIPADYSGIANSCECENCRESDILQLTNAFSDTELHEKMKILNKLKK